MEKKSLSKLRFGKVHYRQGSALEQESGTGGPPRARKFLGIALAVFGIEAIVKRK
jgi:hypothetical protein